MNTLDLALNLVDMGIKIIPCHSRIHPRAKSPIAELAPNGQHSSSTDKQLVRSWFEYSAVMRIIGIPCKDNGIFAVDVDGWEGQETWEAWVAEYGLSEPTATQKTPRGQHYLYRHPDFDFAGSVGKIGNGIDLRSNNYVCTGGDESGYQWQIPITLPLPEAPQWLLDKIKQLKRSEPPELYDRADQTPGDPDLVINYWLDKYVNLARIGSRDSSAYALGQQLYYSRIPISKALGLARFFAERVPQTTTEKYTAGEYCRAIRSAYSGQPKEPATLPRSVTRPQKSNPEPKSEPKVQPKVQPKVEPKPEPKTDPKVEPKVEAKIEPKNESKNEELPPTRIQESAKSEKRENAPVFSTWADLDGLLGPIEWDWPGWLARGFLHILVGMVGDGKSTLALRIIESYLNGRDFPDGQPYTGSPANVIWCEAEAAQALNNERAELAKLPKNCIYSPLPNPDEDFRLSNPEHMALLATAAKMPEARLIVVDSLSGADPKAEKSAEDAKNVNWLATLARDVQKPVILTHHLRKRGMFDSAGEVSLDRVRGTSTILQYARVIWAIDTPDPNDKETKRLSVIKSNLARKPEPIGFTINDHITFVDAPEPPKYSPVISSGIDLLEALLQKGPVSAEQIEREFTGAGISRRTMFEAKKAIGAVSTRKDNKWIWGLRADE